MIDCLDNCIEYKISEFTFVTYEKAFLYLFSGGFIYIRGYQFSWIFVFCGRANLCLQSPENICNSLNICIHVSPVPTKLMKIDI